MYQAEGSDHATRPGWGHKVRDDGEGLVLRTAIGFDKRTGCSAQPRAAHRIPDECQQRLIQLAIRLHLNGGVVYHKRVGNLLEVLHVGPEDDRLAEDRRLEDVVTAVVDKAAADEH